ncbi:MAG: hypothetical protein GXP54_09735 [Deltaproteobacteria bacterium]|nr:hypothetical protein [Deltaproteobacteria bacterium]
MAELGSYLVSGREQAGMSAKDIAQVTRIPVRTVQALEQERWHDLPEAAFVRGFVVNYCRTVGLDDGPALETLATVVRKARQNEKPHPIPDPGPTNILVSSRRTFTWTYMAIILVFTLGIMLAVLLAGTGGNDGLSMNKSQSTPTRYVPGGLPNG